MMPEREVRELLHTAAQGMPLNVPPIADIVEAGLVGAARRRRQHFVLTAAAATAIVVLAATAMFSGLLRSDNRSTGPTAPLTTPTPTPTPSERPSESPSAVVEQPGLIRHGAFPVVPPNEANGSEDPRDADVADIDIRSILKGVLYHGLGTWQFQLAAKPPTDPALRIIAYGIVVDGDGDQQADCQIGINNDATRKGEFRVWVTNLDTDETAVKNGPGYGWPVDFVHPAAPGWPVPVMHFSFLSGMKTPGPCDPFGDSSTFYAWSSVTESGQVTAWDYAPDAAWLPMTHDI